MKRKSIDGESCRSVIGNVQIVDALKKNRGGDTRKRK
jgi:hypothetical protein